MTGTTTRCSMRLAVAATTLLIGAPMAGPAAAQVTAAQTGDYLFRTYCAACHGTSAKGDGPLAESMRRKPADLTEIARRNKGVFPTEEVFRIIDGRQPVRGHGGPDMPVWGDVFARSEGGSNPAVVEARVKALVAYLEGMQTKTAY